jgi:hypothetical protein
MDTKNECRIGIVLLFSKLFLYMVTRTTKLLQKLFEPIYSEM